MEQIEYQIRGRAPLICHSDRSVNPLDPLTKEIAKLTGKGKKSDEDYAQISRLEFEIGLYHDADIGPYIPGNNLLRMMRDGAVMTRRGKDVERAVFMLTERAKIEYDGPRDIDKMWLSDEHTDIRSIKIKRSGSRTMRCRPIFRDWALRFEFLYDTSIFEAEALNDILKAASLYVGLGDFRPRYGRFEII